jgi:hypothetical protein
VGPTRYSSSRESVVFGRPSTLRWFVFVGLEVEFQSDGTKSVRGNDSAHYGFHQNRDFGIGVNKASGLEVQVALYPYLAGCNNGITSLDNSNCIAVSFK